jgi:alpha-D-xyloside xylohydrolase
MISVWPKLGASTQDFKEMKKNPGFLYTDTAQQSIYDAFNPEARKLFWDQANNGLFSKGIDAWWCDATEPELMGWNWDLNNYREIMKPFIGSGSRYMNAYSLMQSKGMYENQRQTTSDKRVFILTRSAYPGLQKYGAAAWSGDIDGTWDVFKKQIPAGLNFCMSGIPYWTTDIGGFFVHGINNFKPDRTDPPVIADENYKRLYVRWFQYGAFCPLFRSHGTDLPREIWRFGEPGSWAYDALVQATKLRYHLMPYIYSNAWRVTSHRYTLMRALFLDFPDDTVVYKIADQYMFGPSILVNPVTDSLAIWRKVYLPNTEWFNFWTGELLKGGQWIDANAPISQIPLFIKAGSIIPVSPDIQFANEKTYKPVTIWIYPGADADFQLYEDEGDNYNYEKGLYSIIPIVWEDSAKKLTFKTIQGDYPGMKRKRLFHIMIAGKDKGIGVMDALPDKIVEYNGESVSVWMESK